MAAAFSVAKTIEDLEFLDESKVGANDAAERTGFASAEAMEKWLERHDAYDLWLAFKKRDPVGFHDNGQRRERRERAAKNDPMIAVLDAADESTRAATRRKADRVRTLLAELKSTVAAERADDEQNAAARTEIERLERELAKAKARLKGRTTLTVASGVSAAQLREWAQEKGIDCPPVGRIPNAVKDAYETEQAS